MAREAAELHGDTGKASAEVGGLFAHLSVAPGLTPVMLPGPRAAYQAYFAPWNEAYGIFPSCGGPGLDTPELLTLMKFFPVLQ